MKKETLQTLAIIVICLAACFAGCKTSVPVEKKIKKNASLIALIKYQSGMVEKITDSFGIAEPGDTVITIDYSALMPDSSIVKREYIWGVPNEDGIVPSTLSEDSLYVEFNKVTVLKIFHVCIDPSHKTCDGECTCDGMECSDQ